MPHHRCRSSHSSASVSSQGCRCPPCRPLVLSFTSNDDTVLNTHLPLSPVLAGPSRRLPVGTPSGSDSSPATFLAPEGEAVCRWSYDSLSTYRGGHMPSVSGWVRIPVVRRSPSPSKAVGVVLEYQPPSARSGWVRYLGRPWRSPRSHRHPLTESVLTEHPRTRWHWATGASRGSLPGDNSSNSWRPRDNQGIGEESLFILLNEYAGSPETAPRDPASRT